MYCAQWVGRDTIVCGGCEHNMLRVIDRGTLNVSIKIIITQYSLVNSKSQSALITELINKNVFMKAAFVLDPSFASSLKRTRKSNKFQTRVDLNRSSSHSCKNRE